ncbi:MULTISPECIES: hypothetical protein [unclassified Dehalobacter]|jgi:hypothetical protein|uniref:hypothetical protein n=1 Tax=unclassified Dehalobacter TaxID=2635733 RepID=UPI00028ABB9C|nr:MULTISPECIES: hypothetical protein [unclassified Dehalobacter]AFV01116.1 hypothetical protein DHBDCA_p88 [Dehalobacter sp. DCA]AFV04159.1 hypothetical protein DCF50_p153 [Dehalobacter sp. CF]
MSTYDDLFRPENEQPIPGNGLPFDKEAWKQQKQEQRELVYSIIDDAAGTVAQDGVAYQKYLDLQSRFDRYSVANVLLILAQKPDATRIADFDTWKEQGIFIRKKESGFYILEPGDEYQREDGSVGISYNPKKMFDISQTGNRKRQDPALVSDERTRLKALMEHALVPIRISDALPEGVNALYYPEVREIQIRRGMDAGNIFRTLSQELAHAEMDTGNENYSRTDHAFHAYSVSYMLCRQYGVDTGEYRFGRAPEMLKGMNAQEIRAELSVIREAAGEICGRMNRMLAQQREHLRKEPVR